MSKEKPCCSRPLKNEKSKKKKNDQRLKAIAEYNCVSSLKSFLHLYMDIIWGKTPF